MKEKILIYSIFRNSEKTLTRYHHQLKLFVDHLKKDYDFCLSIYENDSTDDTKNILKSLDFSFVDDVSILLEDIGSSFFGSVIEEQRVKNLSAARLKAISAKDYLDKSQKVLCIESDIMYSTDCIKKLLNFQKTYDLQKVDIVSGVSVTKDNKLYDAWATRKTDFEEWGELFHDWKDKKFDKYYSTFNCLCLYDANIIRQGGTYGWFNERLKKFDCDTAVICENFHALGHHEIFINYESVCTHIKNKGK